MIQRLSYLKRKAGLWHSLPDWRPHFYCVVKKPSLQLSRKCLGVVLQQEKAFEGLYFDGSAYFSPCSCCFLWEQFLSDYCVLLAFLVWRLEGALRFALRFALGPLLRRRPSTTAGVQKKREKKDAIWPNGTWYSLLMKPPWREKWVLKVYNIKFPDSLDAQSNSACASEPPWPPTFFITPSIPRATTISLQLQWSPLGGPFWSIFIQLEANFPRPVFSAFFKVTLDK